MLLVVAHTLASLGFASMILLPLYLDHLGALRAEIGALMAAASIGGLLSRPLVGAALDAWGRKPTLTVGTLFAVAAMGLVWLVVDVGATAWGMRILFGVGEGAMFSAYFTFVADVVPDERRTEGIALFGVSGLVPLAVSPLAALSGVDAADLRWFLPAAGLVVLSSLLFLALIPEPGGKIERSTLSVGAALRALRARPLWSCWLGTIVFGGLVSLFMAFASVVAERRGISLPTGLWLLYAGGAASVRLVGARLPDRVGPANLFTPALACYIAAVMIATEASTDMGFLAAGLFAGLGHGYCFPVLTTQVVGRVPEAYRGSGLSLFTALFGVAALLINPTCGAVADRYGDAVMLWVASTAATGGLALWAVLEHYLGGARRSTATTSAA